MRSTYIVETANRMFVFGSNGYGQLGLGAPGKEDKQNRNIPTLHTASEGKLVDLVVGGYNMAYITTDEDIFSVGRNDFKQLGRSGPSTSIPGFFNALRDLPYLEDSAPQRVNFRMFGASFVYQREDNYKFFLLNCGGNQYGQLGFGDTKVIDLGNKDDGRVKVFREEQK